MERLAWLALLVLEVEGGRLGRRQAVKLIAEKLGYSRKQARNVLRYLIEKGYVAPVTRGLSIAEIEVTEEGRRKISNLLTPTIQDNLAPVFIIKRLAKPT